MNVYEVITLKIIAQLEAGVVAWNKPWSAKPPVNLISQKQYRGLKSLINGNNG
jgi:antirestriction protein ArdC